MPEAVNDSCRVCGNEATKQAMNVLAATMSCTVASLVKSETGKFSFISHYVEGQS